VLPPVVVRHEDRRRVATRSPLSSPTIDRSAQGQSSAVHSNRLASSKSVAGSSLGDSGRNAAPSSVVAGMGVVDISAVLHKATTDMGIETVVWPALHCGA
jgi:hypothetical protein